MKQRTITLMTIVILYMMGYTAKERATKESFYGKWVCERERLLFYFNGLCKIYNIYGYLTRYEKRKEDGRDYYDMYIHQNKQDIVLSLYIENEILYVNQKRFVRM